MLASITKLAKKTLIPKASSLISLKNNPFPFNKRFMEVQKINVYKIYFESYSSKANLVHEKWNNTANNATK